MDIDFSNEMLKKLREGGEAALAEALPWREERLIEIEEQMRLTAKKISEGAFGEGYLELLQMNFYVATVRDTGAGMATYTHCAASSPQENYMPSASEVEAWESLIAGIEDAHKLLDKKRAETAFIEALKEELQRKVKGPKFEVTLTTSEVEVTASIVLPA